MSDYARPRIEVPDLRYGNAAYLTRVTIAGKILPVMSVQWNLDVRGRDGPTVTLVIPAMDVDFVWPPSHPETA